VSRNAQFQIRQYAQQHNMFKDGAYEIKIDNNKKKISKKNSTNDKFSIRTVSDECCQRKFQNSILQFPLKHQLL